MIDFEKLRWKNLLSYGNQFTELDLKRSPSTMITGANGAGKSTMLEALCFVLFGKPFRKINKPQLVNTKNARELLVEIEFTIGSDKYLIRRGVKPEVFEIIKNDVWLNQPGSSRDYQAQLENQILRFDYAAFTQLVCVGKATHVSFMKLDSNKRRQFIEGILSLIVFSNMNKLHATKMSQMRERSIALKGDLAVANERVVSTQRYIKDLEEQIRNSARADKKAKLELIASLESQIAEDKISLDSEMEQLYDTSDLENFTRQLREITSLSSKITLKLQDTRKDLKKLEDTDSCYACGQALDFDERQVKIDVMRANVEKLDVACKDIADKQNNIEAQVDQLNDKQRRNDAHQRTISALNASIKSKNAQIEQIQEQFNEKSNLDQSKIDTARGNLAQYSEELQKLHEEREESAVLNDYFSLIATMLKDTGIKAMFIKKFIPIINYYINQNLAKLNFFAKFTLDENFNETIMARGIDTLSYHNFSEGEKLRIDMAILLAWREIAKAQNNMSTNLLILDEIADSSMDQQGSEALSLLLNETRGLNLFVITHTPEKIADKMRSTITFYQDKGFSKMRA